MVYRKKSSFRKKRSFKPRARKAKGSWVDTAMGVAKTAATALTIAKSLADVVNVEYKETNPLYVFTPNYDGFSYDITSNIGQGVNNGQRVGDSLKLQRLTCRYQLTQGAAGAGNIPETFRIIIFRDEMYKVPDTNPGAGAYLLEGAATPYATMSSKLEQTKYHTRFLYDRTHKVIPNTSLAIQNHQFQIPLNWHVNYKPGLPDVEGGALKVLVITNTSSNSNANCVMQFGISYTDN